MQWSSLYLVLPLLLFMPGIASADGEELGGSSKVTVKSLASLLINPQEDAPAQVISLNDSQLSSEIAGKIVEMAVEVGDVVEQGAVLVRLDPWLYLSQLQQAEEVVKELEVELLLAKKERERSRRLKKKGQTTAAALDTKIAQVNLLTAKLSGQKSRVEESRTRLGKMVLRAPFPGVITQRSGQIGSWARSDIPLLRLVDLTRVELVAEVAASQVKQLKIASKLNFIYLDNRYPVTLRTILPTEKESTHSREVRLSFTGALPPPGASGRLSWIDSRPYLPPWIMVRRGGGLGIFVYKNSKASFFRIEGAREGVAALLPEMVVTGQVVVDGREALEHGDTLSIYSPATKTTE
ncbi:MAG: efflux RND transporter periplasmic adaptor subunit [Magnetococcales bacterium]|nr:efflux RND transporter periplasmic adaptor subunit [Magnetococcales bacterium]